MTLDIIIKYAAFYRKTSSFDKTSLESSVTILYFLLSETIANGTLSIITLGTTVKNATFN